MLFFCGFWCCSLFKTILWVAVAAGVETVECTSDWYSYLSFGEVITAQPFISSLPSPQYHHHHRWLLIGCEDGRQITRWHSSTLNTKPLAGQFGQIQENSDKSWQIGANPGKWFRRTSWIFSGAAHLPPVYGSRGTAGGRLYWLCQLATITVITKEVVVFVLVVNMIMMIILIMPGWNHYCHHWGGGGDHDDDYSGW